MSDQNDSEEQKKRIYFAAPLFSKAERDFNLQVTELLEEFATVYLPQRDGGLMTELVDQGVCDAIAARHIFNIDVDAIRKADLFIAILDGRAVDEGVAFELGVAFSLNKQCIGLQTDSRRLATWGNNPMITGALEQICTSVDEFIECVRITEPLRQSRIKNSGELNNVGLRLFENAGL